MTYDQAVTVRTLQLQGINVGDKALNQAISIIRNTRTHTARPKYVVAVRVTCCDECPHAARLMAMGGQVVEVK